ncbi:MAG: hypothetical protein NC428_10795 [Clostridium sp.]|nr:hypothetical protein [Clostridium sp.]
MDKICQKIQREIKSLYGAEVDLHDNLLDADILNVPIVYVIYLFDYLEKEFNINSNVLLDSLTFDTFTLENISKSIAMITI